MPHVHRAGSWAVPPGRWGADSPEHQVLWRETMEVLQAALVDLLPNQQAVVTLRDIEGLDSEEVCRVLGVSDVNHRVLLHRGRAKLRTALQQHYCERR